jgi:cysteine desulfurase / selenocysteine lyase
MKTVQKLRDLLPKLSPYCYLNYAGMGPLLAPTVKLLQNLVEMESEYHPANRDKWTALLDSARKSVARLINASSDEIAFVTSTSDGLSLFANAIRWKEGDRILYPADEFPSNRFVWDNLKQKGVHAEAIEPKEGVSFTRQLSQMDLKRVRLVSLSAVSYWDGRVQDIAELSRFCKERGILVAVDAIQALGAVPFDVKTAGCDFLAAGAKKWLFGPIGTGFVYVRKERMNELFVPNVGWGSVMNLFEFEAKTFAFADSARRFEPGTLDLPAIGALACSIDTMQSIGLPQIYAAIAHWNEVMQKGFKSLGYNPLHHGTRSGIVAILLKDLAVAEELKNRLAQSKIILTQRKDYLRISAHASTTQNEIDRFFEELGRKP